MSVANSLISASFADQSAQIKDLSDQVAALTTSVSTNASGVNANLNSITSLVFAIQQDFIVKTIGNSAIDIASNTPATLFDDAPEAGKFGNYVFKLTGTVQTGRATTLAGYLIFSNTVAGPSYQLPISTASDKLSFSYTGFANYVSGSPIPKMDLVATPADVGSWGYADISLTFYRVQQIAPP